MKTRLLIIIGIAIIVISAIIVGFFILSSNDQKYSKENPYGFSAKLFYSKEFLPVMCPVPSDCSTHLKLKTWSDVPAILQGYKICSRFSCVSQDDMQFSTKDSGIIPIFDGNKWNVGDKVSIKVQVVTEYGDQIHPQPETFYIDLGESEIVDDVWHAEPKMPIIENTNNENINPKQPDSSVKTSENDAIFRMVILNPNDIDASLVQTKIVLGEPIDELDSGVTFSPAYVKTMLNYHNAITWINKNKEPITLESDDGYFNTKINSTESFSVIFYKPGVYKYHSPINWKSGTILVSTPEIESSNLHPAKLLEKNHYEIAKIIATSLIPEDKIVKTRLDDTIMSAYVTDEDADIIVPKSLGILNDLQTFDEIQYHYGMTKGLVFPKDEQVGLDFAKDFLEKIGYHLDGSEWIDTVNFGNRIQVTIQQKIQGWIIPNHIVQFDFAKDYTWVSLGRWYDDASQYEFKLSQDDAKKISKEYMDAEIKSRPTLQEYDYSFESIQDGVRVIIFDDKPFYMVPITYKANADMHYEVGHCGSNQFLTVYVMVEGKTGTVMGWNYPGCE